MRSFAVFLSVLTLVASGCAGDTPEVPVGPDGVADPVLVLGREVYASECANCHGPSGGGDRGSKLSDGSTLENYPEVADTIELVESGQGAMPEFEGDLTPAEIEAVVRFVREVL